MSDRYLFVGGVSSIWMVEYIKNIYDWKKKQISVIAFAPMDDELKNEYHKMKVDIINLDIGNTLIKQIYKAIYLIYFAIKHRIKNDIKRIEVHMPSASMQMCFIRKMMQIVNCNGRAVFWGTDILGIDKKQAKKMEALMKTCDNIVLGTAEMRKKFAYYYGEKYNDKIINAKFGSIAFDSIKNALSQYSKADCKKKLGIARDKIVIAIGYSGMRRQQHLNVINALDNLSNDNKAKIVLLIHMGNQYDNVYLEEIKKALEKSGLESCILCKNYSVKDIAIVRIATDIFLHAQISDASSSSIRECIYAKAILINPVWINYEEYDRLGIEYLQYEKFDELSELVGGVLTDKINIDKEKNAILMYNNFSWEAVKKQWG